MGDLPATPHVLDYDLAVLAIAIAFFASHRLAFGFHRGEINMYGLAWLMPLLTCTNAGAVEVPLGRLAMIAFYALVLRRPAADHRTSLRPHAHIATA